MTVRTFKQTGQSYGSVPTTIVAKIGGVVVFDGAISTLDQPPPILGDSSAVYVDLFGWENTVDFSGTQEMEITVANNPLYLSQTLANYNWNAGIATGAASFGTFYLLNDVTDPLSNVVINGIPQTISPEIRDLSINGQWHWVIPAGTTFVATVNVSQGFEPAP